MTHELFFEPKGHQRLNKDKNVNRYAVRGEKERDMLWKLRYSHKDPDYCILLGIRQR